MDVNELRRLLLASNNPDDLAAANNPNMLAALLNPQQQQQMQPQDAMQSPAQPQPQAPMQQQAPVQQDQPSQAALDMMPSGPGAPRNFIQRTNGPDAGRVVDIDKFIADRQQGQPGMQASSLPGAPQQAQRMLRVIGTGNGTTVDLGTEPMSGNVSLDYTRPQIETMGGKAYYSKDEPYAAYVLGADGKPKTKILLGYDMAGSMALNKANQERQQGQAQIAHMNAETDEIGAPKYQLTQNGDVFNPKTGQVVASGVAQPKNLTESQGKATGLASRAQAAHDILTGFEGQGVTTPSLIKQGVDSVPMVGGALATAVNKMGIPSTEQNQVEQAQRDFVNAALRVESGASINQSEFDNARKQYFPQPGDSAEVIKQKQQGREREIRSLSIQAGPGASQVRGGTTLQSPPNPARYTGKTMEAPDGTHYKSDGTRWVRIT